MNKQTGMLLGSVLTAITLICIAAAPPGPAISYSALKTADFTVTAGMVGVRQSYITTNGGTITGNLTVNGLMTNNGRAYIDQLVTPSIRLRRYVLTHAGTVTLDWSTNTVQKIVLTGDVVFACSNLDTNRTYDLIIANSQATNCAITWPTNIYNPASGITNFFGYRPTYISPYQHGWFQGQVGCQTNWLVHGVYSETGQ
jgi:hypothetical protein